MTNTSSSAQLLHPALSGSETISAPGNEIFDQIAWEASRLPGVEAALVSFDGGGHQYFKARHGITLARTTSDCDLCAQTLESDDVLWVEDALRNPRFAQSALVQGEPYVRFFAGAPIHSASGTRVGAVCIVAPRPKARDDVLVTALRDLARRASLATGPRDLTTRELRLQVDALSAEIENVWSLVGAMARVINRLAPEQMKAEAAEEWSARYDIDDLTGDDFSAASLASFWSRLNSLELDPPGSAADAA
ncbi:MAG: GAF domain-containing protein [Caulobacteraceae bacterium]